MGILKTPTFFDSEIPPEKMRQLAEVKAQLAEVRARHAKRVQNDPATFVRERCKETVWSKQEEILNSIRDHRLTTVRSCHGSGKSWTVARAVAWWVTCHPPGTTRVITTAPTFKQVRAVLWQEIRKAHAAGNLPGECMQVEWQVEGNLVAQGIKPDDAAPDAFQGIHAPHLLVVLDEANGVAPAIWKAALSLATSANNRIIAIGNPDDPHGMFAETHRPDSGWNQIKIGYGDTPNFTGEQVPQHVSDVLISEAWIKDAKKMYGEGSPLYISKVHGEFPEESDDSLIKMRFAREAVNRHLPATEPYVMGVDVARMGSDRTVIVLRKGPQARLYKVFHQKNTMETVGHVRLALDQTGASNVAVDADGLGAGVFDRLSELGEAVQELRGGFRARDADRFANRRAEWYWTLRDKFEAGEIDIEENDELLSQLTSIKWKPNSRGQIQLETKDDMRKRGLPSPDLADALAYSFAAWDLDWAAAYAATEQKKVVDGEVVEPPPNPWLQAYGDYKPVQRNPLELLKQIGEDEGYM